jgi:predicted GTPase
MKKRVIIMGAAGRDFHNFNVFFRDNDEYEVVAFTATQIPNIEGRKYPAELAGSLYPNGIDIYPESELDDLIKKFNVDLVVFSYSDVSHEYVMHKASQAMTAGAAFMLLGPKQTMLESTKPVIAICAGRTGSGKSQTTRRVVEILRNKGKRVVVVRHPMPYGDLVAQKVQRFATYEDLDIQKCTIEEREEYEPHIDRGAIVYAGVDYEAILRQAEQEADVVLWDGGNNDFPFYKPNLMITVVDPHRPGHEVTYHPGEINVRMADVIVINKVDTADFEDIEMVRENVRNVNPHALIIDAASPLFVEDPSAITGKRVVVVEDGPTLTHGGMSYGAGYIAAIKYGASEIISPKPYAVGSIAATYDKYTQVEDVLPAMGYSDQQIKDLEQSLNSVPADVVVSGTPINISRLVKLNKPIVRVMYELEEIGKPTLEDVISEKMGW